LSYNRTGSIGCALYSIGTDVNDPKFLLNVEKGWQASEAVRLVFSTYIYANLAVINRHILNSCLHRFCLSQPECKKVSKDNRDYTPEEYPPDRDLDD
jgi:hypothetical protein